ncbi:MAG: AraC family transcriptional regulator [Bacteroidetes bacterium]|nr:AraC family transcriptional regulator [Bacteroidota bacterium]
MKPFKEVINYPVDNSFVIKYDNLPHFRFPFHFHEEYEIVFIEKSFGKKFVGDAVEEFAPGDLSIYGSNLPHFYMSDPLFYKDDKNLRVNSIVVQFPKLYFPEEQLARSEFGAVKRLLNSASSGLSFSPESAEKGAKMLHKIIKASGMDRHLLFVKLIDYLGNSKSSNIASHGYANEMQDQQEPRMAKIYKFTTRNYNRKIELEEVASVASMNVSAFCRYFRQKSGKTFSQFVNEQRISYACKFLKHGNRTISGICDEAGFNNISNFNRQFKNITGKSPSEYRKFFKDK